MTTLETILLAYSFFATIALFIHVWIVTSIVETSKELSDLNQNLIKRLYESADMTQDIILAVQHGTMQDVVAALNTHMALALHIKAEEEKIKGPYKPRKRP